MPDDFNITGSCQCRAVRYAVSAPAHEVDHCHCSVCRKSHGAMFGTYATADRAAFRFTEGEDNLSDFEVTPGVTRRFCRTCGCHLVVIPEAMPEIIWYTPATLDGADPGHPRETEKHIHVASQQPWWSFTDDRPKFDGLP